MNYISYLCFFQSNFFVKRHFIFPGIYGKNNDSVIYAVVGKNCKKRYLSQQQYCYHKDRQQITFLGIVQEHKRGGTPTR